MKLVKGSLVRANANLNIRETAGASAKWLGSIQKNAIACALASPVSGWVKVQVNGYARDSEPRVVYSDPSELSSIDAKRSVDTWHDVTIEGHVSTQYLTVEDGPA